MIKNINKFDEFISESFSNGIQTRELRLSYKELQHLKRRFPNATIKNIYIQDQDTYKKWYNINLGQSS